jgi:hypothetical protein
MSPSTATTTRTGVVGTQNLHRSITSQHFAIFTLVGTFDILLFARLYIADSGGDASGPNWSQSTSTRLQRTRAVQKRHFISTRFRGNCRCDLPRRITTVATGRRLTATPSRAQTWRRELFRFSDGHRRSANNPPTHRGQLKLRPENQMMPYDRSRVSTMTVRDSYGLRVETHQSAVQRTSAAAVVFCSQQYKKQKNFKPFGI